jgi:L-2-hydroxyglutarate oxidase LhgO
MTESVDCAVIGAGVVGLAVARALALKGREVVVLEAAEAVGTATSSRHSEVIHAGIYYPTFSLKARFCVAGRRAMYAYCAERGVPYRNCGKLIVACSEDEKAGLAKLKAQAQANGVGDLQYLEPREVKRLEPAVECVGALLSPSTGILDSHAFMLSLQGDAEQAGAAVAFLSPVKGGRVSENGVELEVGGADPLRLKCRVVVNSAGNEAPLLAGKLRGFPSQAVPRRYFCKGNYFTLQGVKPPFTRLIYPAPEKAGLGVHVTVDMGGQAKFGPDVEWVDDPRNLDVDPKRAEKFYAAIRRYWPGLPDGALSPGYAGMRPKLQAPGEPAADFMAQGPREHGVKGLVNLYGIESPGMTAALAIAEHVCELLEAQAA